MSIQIVDVEGADAGRPDVPIRDGPRAGRGMLNRVLVQPGVRLIHVAGDDGDVLEPAVVAPRLESRLTAIDCLELVRLRAPRVEATNAFGSPSGGGSSGG